MTNVCIKFEMAGPNQTLVIDWARLYMMDGWMDRRTAAKQYTPSSSKGDIAKESYKTM